MEIVKYQGCFEKAKRLYKTANADQRYVLENLFPELKESEDERIRKELITFLEELSKLGENTNFDKWKISDCANWIAWLEKQGDSPIKWNKNIEGNKPQVNHSVLMKTTLGIVEGEWKGEYWLQYRWVGMVEDSDVLSWMELSDLEKQGEQKPADKVEPKFKVGDWIISNEKLYIYRIEEINEFVVKVREINGETFVVDVKCLNDAHLWTIQDAKDGDVLCLYYNNRKTFFIFKAIIGEGDYADILVHCCYTGKYQYLEPSFNGECRMHQISDGGYCLPADKEEQGILFQKMKEAGYEWDADNKELKKIHVIDEGKAEMDYCFTKMMNGEKVSSAWSEEDENISVAIENHLIEYYVEKRGYPYVANKTSQEMKEFRWLKSLKQRIGG